MKLKYLLLVSVSILLSVTSSAKEFGQQGNSFRIEEQSFIEMIEERLQSVDIEREREKMEQKARDRVNTPKAVEAIEHATKQRSILFDPTYLLKEDIVLPCGEILHKAGSTVNPLDHIEFDRRLIFIDGSDLDHIEWLKNLLQTQPASQLEDRIILIKGSPLQLQEEINLDIYFDQSGVLTKHFGVRAVPAVIVQEGLKLRIEEIVI